jgi:hypothetical protein
MSPTPDELATALFPGGIPQTAGLVQRSKEVSISSDAEYQEADRYLTTQIEPEIDRLKATFDPLTALKKRLLDPLLRIKKAVQAMMIEYDASVRESQRQQHEAKERSIREQAEKEMLEEVGELLDQGTLESTDEASELISEMSAPKVNQIVPFIEQRPKAAGRSVATLKRFRVVNPQKVKPPYLKTIVDEKKIQRLVIAVYKEAEEIVGGIEVYKLPSMRRKPKRS